MFENYNSEKLQKITCKISEKSLVQIEGATCSGKSTLVLAVYRMLKQRGINVMVLEEAAHLILKENQNLLEQLIRNAPETEHWRKAKIQLQQEVLTMQIEGLERFAEDANFEIAVMDRGGASTAYHTMPLLPDEKKGSLEEICREITEMSDQIILLPNLGFLKQNSFRYQSDLEEIEDEFTGIKNYLDKWKSSYLEIPRTQSAIQVKTAIQYILTLKKASDNSKRMLKQLSRC